MNKSVVIGIVIGVVIASAGAVIANYAVNSKSQGEDAVAESESEGPESLLSLSKPAPDYADVLSVTPVVEQESTPREVCENYEVTEKAPVKDENQITGAVAGAVIGGVLGNQVGGGSGKKVATVAGAVAGGFAGKKVQETMQDKNTTTHMETRCETVYDTSEVIRGYDVAYRLGDKEDIVRMSYDPGEKIRLEDGELKIH